MEVSILDESRGGGEELSRQAFVAYQSKRLYCPNRCWFAVGGDFVGDGGPWQQHVGDVDGDVAQIIDLGMCLRVPHNHHDKQHNKKQWQWLNKQFKLIQK